MKYLLIFSIFISIKVFATATSQDLGTFDINDSVNHSKTIDREEEAMVAAAFGSFDLNGHNSRVPTSLKLEKNWKQDPHVTEMTGTFR
ncbi:MAG: hypothetical protein ACOYL6_08735 [Bacteriovoracaceae bacterium]